MADPPAKRLKANDTSAKPVPPKGAADASDDEGEDTAKLRTVFVSGLSSKATQHGLREFFETCGVVKECHLSVRDSGQVIAFVEFGDEQAARAAVKTSGAFVDGMKVNVQPKRTAGGAAAKEGRMPKSTSVFVKFLDGNKVSSSAIEKAFEVCGKLKDVRMHVSKAFCFIEFHTLEASRLATQLRDPRFQVHYSTQSQEKEASAVPKEQLDAAKKSSALLFKPRNLKRK
eukprot:TRINITY_DN7946_c0_g1_i1.p3 TRINITY_DN7946_c0_g1~~TRINITY_DN7946_c0_g1_i1.p3  ORF type:complete len:229 (+),score=80.79 TRINITY_DN7946_c0_g1_i1:69-755(+)